MTRILTVLFDGEVLRPQESVDLRANTYYHVIIQDEVDDDAHEETTATSGEDEVHPLAKFTKYAIDTGISDLAEQHDHYLYGTPKR
ncbi:MAG: hypothetical protein AB7R89_32525 [Dehalococcoidia bacterium]